jgi:hypothetical protein
MSAIFPTEIEPSLSNSPRSFAVCGDPLKDMNNMKNVIFVMKEGKVFVDKRNE